MGNQLTTRASSSIGDAASRRFDAAVETTYRQYQQAVDQATAAPPAPLAATAASKKSTLLSLLAATGAVNASAREALAFVTPSPRRREALQSPPTAIAGPSADGASLADTAASERVKRQSGYAHRVPGIGRLLRYTYAEPVAAKDIKGVLFRGDSRSPAAVHNAGGFHQPGGPRGNYDLRAHLSGASPKSAFVSLSADMATASLYAAGPSGHKKSVGYVYFIDPARAGDVNFHQITATNELNRQYVLDRTLPWESVIGYAEHTYHPTTHALEKVDCFVQGGTVGGGKMVLALSAAQLFATTLPLGAVPLTVTVVQSLAEHLDARRRKGTHPPSTASTASTPSTSSTPGPLETLAPTTPLATTSAETQTQADSTTPHAASDSLPETTSPVTTLGATSATRATMPSTRAETSTSTASTITAPVARQPDTTRPSSTTHTPTSPSTPRSTSTTAPQSPAVTSPTVPEKSDWTWSLWDYWMDLEKPPYTATE